MLRRKCGVLILLFPGRVWPQWTILCRAATSKEVGRRRDIIHIVDQGRTDDQDKVGDRGACIGRHRYRHPGLGLWRAVRLPNPDRRGTNCSLQAPDRLYGAFGASWWFHDAPMHWTCVPYLALGGGGGLRLEPRLTVRLFPEEERGGCKTSAGILWRTPLTSSMQ